MTSTQPDHDRQLTWQTEFQLRQLRNTLHNAWRQTIITDMQVIDPKTSSALETIRQEIRNLQRQIDAILPRPHSGRK